MKKILIVEDDHDIRESLKDLLEMNNFSVSTAANGAEAIFEAEANKPDLILSDLMMPGINGLDLLRIIQNKEELAHIPFVFLTAKVDHESMRTGMNLGADDYLTKPIKKNELLSVINKRLEKSEAIKKNVETDLASSVGKLNSFVQHEFNTPLNGILGFVQLLKNVPNISPDKILYFADIIETSGTRLKNVLDNILMYRAIVTKSLYVREESFLLHQEAVAKMANSIAKNYGRMNDLTLNPVKEVTISGDETHFYKILHELLDNAFKFSVAGESLTVRLISDPATTVLTIADAGRGLSTEQLAQVGAFVQFDRELYEQQGLGLGLYISKNLALFNQWRLDIKNQGKGTVCQLIMFNQK